MCGIFGHTDLNQFSEEQSLEALNKQIHRGPDGFGYASVGNVFLGHRRLSILDLSDNGKQPMQSGSVYLTVNGEIYNFMMLRKELEQDYGVIFNSKSDSEVLLHGYVHWGIETLLDKIDGMFAFCIVDAKNDKIYLARDHAGIKPLYYANVDGVLSWASELKSIEHLYKDRDCLSLDYEALYDFLTYQYIPSPKSMYKDVYKLEPAHYIEYTISTHTYDKKRYWSLDACTQETPMSFDQAKEHVKKALSYTVKEQLVSDVPVGTFLSGGVDSSAVSYEASQCLEHLNTFCQGNKSARADESNYAQMVADVIGADHHMRVFDHSIINQDFELMKRLYDEPFAQTSAYPTYQVCKHASEQLTVVLTGDGGDELFGGYGRYKKAGFVFNSKAKSAFSRRVINVVKSLLLHRTLKRRLDKKEIKSYLSDPMERLMTQTEGLHKTNLIKKKWAKKYNIPESYDDFWFVRQFDRPELSPKKRMQFIDFNTYLPEAVLTKVDRASMAVSIETRVPFLSKRMISLAFSLAENVHHKDDELKAVLKSVYAEHLPHDVLYRRKQGFTTGRASKKDELYNKERSVPLLMLNKLFDIKL